MLNNEKYKIFSERPYQVSKIKLISSGFRTSPSAHRNIVQTCGSALKNQVDFMFNGSEIGSASYVSKSQHRFLKTANIQNDLLIDLSTMEYCKKVESVCLEGNEILIAEDGGGDGLGESCLYVKDPQYKDYICNGILALRIKDDSKRSFILGFLKSKYFKEYIDNNTAKASTLRHSNGVAKDFILPEYDNTNDSHLLLSMMVDNLIDKENQIISKNKSIDLCITTELGLTTVSAIQASKSLMIKNDFRCAAGLYNQEFLNIYQGILNYSGGSFALLEKYISKRGQNLQVSNIGDSYYSNLPKKGFYRLVTTMELTDRRTIHSYRFLGNLNKLAIVKTNSIMLSADGTVGKSIFVGQEHFISNIHQWILTPKRDIERYKVVFVSLFLQWLRNNNYYEYIKDKANGGAIKESHLQKFLTIPKFPIKTQEAISKYYINSYPKGFNDMSNYLDNEIKRNALSGIWDLNMECFELRAKINKLVEKIVLGKKIHIPYYLK